MNAKTTTGADPALGSTPAHNSTYSNAVNATPPTGPTLPGAAHDPLRVLRDKLDAAGCFPIGRPYKFRARCPVHEGRSPSLSIGEGVDGRALLFCHAGCDADAVRRALGLDWPDLFPDGHRERIGNVAAFRRARTTLDVILDALPKLAINYRAGEHESTWYADGCPACGQTDSDHPDKGLWLFERERGVLTHCWAGCSRERILLACRRTLARPAPEPAWTSDALRGALHVLDVNGIPWSPTEARGVYVGERCPVCRGARLHVLDRPGGVEFACIADCGHEPIERALLAGTKWAAA